MLYLNSDVRERERGRESERERLCVHASGTCGEEAANDTGFVSGGTTQATLHPT